MNIDTNELAEKLLVFEEENQLFLKCYQGIPYWHAIRVSVYIDILYFGRENLIRNSNRVGRFLQIFRIIGQNIVQLFIKKDFKADLLILDDASVYRRIENKDVNIYIDYCKTAFNYSELNIGSLDIRNKRVKKNTAWPMLLFIFAMATNKIIKNRKKGTTELIEIQKNLEMEFDVKINIIEKVEKWTYRYRIFSRYIDKVLDQIQPKAILFVCYYNYYYMILKHRATMKGIPCIELQHGIMLPTNIAYNFKELKNSRTFLPDYILTFGSYWSKSCRLPQSVKCIDVGFPYMHERLIQLKSSLYDANSVVFYSGFDRILIDIIMNFIPLALENGIKIYFKPHPSEMQLHTWDKVYPELNKNEFINVIDMPTDIYELFSKYKHHVGIASTTLYEAIGARVCVYSHISGHFYMQNMVEMGCVKEFSTALDLFTLIKQANTKGVDINEEIREELWKPNALHNQINAIRKIFNNEI